MLVFSAYLVSISYRANVIKVIQNQAIYAFFYIFNFFSSYRGFVPNRFFDHLWSLSVEEQFYLLWPLLVFLTPKKWMKQVFIAGILSGLAFRIAFLVAYNNGLSIYFREPVSLAMYPLPFTHVDAFAFGAYISRFSFSKVRKQLLFLGILLPVIGFGAQYLATGEISDWISLGYPVTLPDAYQFIWAYTLINYFFALLIQSVVRENLFVKFLSFAPLAYLGRISYGLYVYHFPLLWFTGRLRDIPAFSNMPQMYVILISFMLTVGISAISFRFVESPLIRLKDRFAFYIKTANNT